MTITEVDIQGNIHVPQEFGIKPRDRVVIHKIDNGVVIKKQKKDIADNIRQMTQETFKDVDWKEIEEEREDREW